MTKIVIDKKLLKSAAEKAALSDHVYLRPNEETPPNGWQLVQRSDKLLGHKSNFFGAMYARENPDSGKKEYVIAFRGTDGNDLKSNFAIAQGKLPPQFAHAMDFVMKACDAEGIKPEETEITGHSLGGYLARAVGVTLPVKKVFAFAGPGPSEKTRAYLNTLMPKNALPNDRIIHIRSKHDVIGLWGLEEKITLELDTKKHHHAIKALRNYLDKKLYPNDPARQPLPVKAGFLERVFNRVSKVVASCATLRVAMRNLFKHADPSRENRDDIKIIPLAKPAVRPAFA